MLRDKSLIPLSHQHQHALALCVRLQRALEAGGADLDTWHAELESIFENEIGLHFAAEEKLLFPAAEKLEPLRPLVKHLRSEHETLRGFFARAKERKLDVNALKTFAETLAQHVRTEERQLFEQFQQLVSAEQLVRLGVAMDEYFRAGGLAGGSCALPRHDQ